MDDYSWIKPVTGNIANIFGLNPEVAARGRQMQAEQDFNAARTANTQADTALSPYRQKEIEARASAQAALAGQYNAAAGKHTSEKGGIDLTNTIRGKIGEAYQAYLTAPEEARRKAAGTLGGLMVQLGGNPSQVADSIRNLESLVNSTSNPELSAQQAKVPAAFGPNATFNAKERKEYQSSRAAASQAEAVAVQQEKNKGSIAESIAQGGAGQRDQKALNDEAQAIKLGAEWAMKVPFNGGFLDEGQAYQLSQAARAANPGLNPQDAIVKFVRDNPKMLQGNWEMFGSNKVDIPGGIPATVPAAPVAPSPAAAAPAAQKSLTKQDVAAMPDGSIIVIQGQQYRKQGGQLVKVK
jgi:hypothetical protein